MPTWSSATASTSFPTNQDCSRRLQVAANVLGTPATFDIYGGGATWVFGREGRLIVDDAATTTSLRVRFNQRYDEADRGGRISIMTRQRRRRRRCRRTSSPTSTRCPGRAASTASTPVPDRRHRVCAVDVAVRTCRWSHRQGPGSRRPDGLHGDIPAATSTARLTHGAILMTWNEVTGQAAGGAFIDGYTVTISSDSPVGPGVLSARRPRGAPAHRVSRQVSCLAKNVATVGPDYTVGVSGTQRGRSRVPSATADRQAQVDAVRVSPMITAPAAPTNVAAVDSNVDDVAQISWTAPANGGSPITTYVATAHRIFLQPQPDQPPVAGDMNLSMRRSRTVVTGVPAFDPNGDALTLLTVNTTAFPAAVGTVTVAGRDITITTTASPPPPARTCFPTPSTRTRRVSSPAGRSRSPSPPRPRRTWLLLLDRSPWPPMSACRS